MPQYLVTRLEVRSQEYLVPADSEAEAIAKVYDEHKDVEKLEKESLLLEQDETRGMSADDNHELAEELRDRGFGIDDVIPSIQSVREFGG